MNFDYVIKSGKVVSGSETFVGDIGIGGGKIRAVGKDLKGPSSDRTYDARDCYVMPGIVDSHTHMSLPVSGTVSSDDFFTGGRAGVHGGVTTIIDFTTPEPGQSLPEAIKFRKEEARECPIDFSFHGTLYGFDVKKGEIQEALDLGVASFKFFTAYGESNRRTPDGELFDAFREIGELGGISMIHCENDEIISHRRKELDSAEKKTIEYHPESRPDFSEFEAVSKVIHLGEKAGGRLHLAHLTTEESVELLEEGKLSGVDLTGETCPQYLLMTESRYEQEDGHRYSATPPLRQAADREALWTGLESGVIDSIATDHCPFQNKQKDKFKDDFLNIPQGLPGIETMAPLIFSDGVRKNRLSIERMVELISSNPARRFGLHPDKGSLTVGTDADIVVFDPNKSKTIKAEALHMNTDFNPYSGKTTYGWPRFVFSRGNPILEGDQFTGSRGAGEWVSRRLKD